MRKLFLFLLLYPAICFSQLNRLSANIFGGFANYSGDLQNKAFTIDQARGAFGAGLSYEITPNISIRGAINYGRVAAHDKYNKPSLKARNLSFETEIYEGMLVGEYNLFDLEEKRFTPYGFLGFALYRFNPFTYDSSGVKRWLIGMGTEGQGMPQYPDRKPYKHINVAIPIGAGIKFRVTDRAVLGYEIGMRKLFTDYLDDVSKTYVDKNQLATFRTPKAAELAYRGGEVKGGDPNYPAVGTGRGSPKYKDWYYFSGITLSIKFFNEEGVFLGAGGSSSKKGRIDCPTRVY